MWTAIPVLITLPVKIVSLTPPGFVLLQPEAVLSHHTHSIRITAPEQSPSMLLLELHAHTQSTLVVSAFHQQISGLLKAGI